MNAPNTDYLDTPCQHADCIGRQRSTDCHNTWWTKCDECGSFHFCYDPMPHQERFHKDPAKYKMWGGGYGSAKTSTCGAEFVDLALRTPNGVGLVGATTYPQLERTSKKQIIDMLPKAFIERMDKKENVMTLINGYEIMFRSFDDEQKLRSLNLCHAWIEEANGTSYSIFTQLQTRLRHHATNRHCIIMSTNPDGNWVRTEILMKANTIYGAREKYHRSFKDKNKDISVHIARTDQNTYLPDGYIDSVKIGKPEWWVSKYLEGSFNMSEGAVYPNFRNAIVEIAPEEIRRNVRTKGWQVIGAGDFGLVDDTVLLLGAIDPASGTVYLYDEYVANKFAVPHHAREMKKRMDHIPQGGLMKLMGDPSGARRGIADRRSIFDHYMEYGIFFQKADNRIDAGIMKVYSYLEMGKLKVLSSLAKTIDEHLKYQYKATELGESADEKPIDKDNHTVDSLRYMVAELPDDPDQLKTATYGVHDLVSEDSQAHLPFALRDDTPSGNPEDWYYGNY